jgi:hypothetical protein
MSDEARSDETVSDDEKGGSTTGSSAAGGGLGLMIGVFGGWIIFDSLALGLLVGMVGLIMGGELSKKTKEESAGGQG